MKMHTLRKHVYGLRTRRKSVDQRLQKNKSTVKCWQYYQQYSEHSAVPASKRHDEKSFSWVRLNVALKQIEDRKRSCRSTAKHAFKIDFILIDLESMSYYNAGKEAQIINIKYYAINLVLTDPLKLILKKHNFSLRCAICCFCNLLDVQKNVK